MTLHAHVQRLEPALQQPAGERVGRLPPDDHLLPHFLDVRDDLAAEVDKAKNDIEQAYDKERLKGLIANGGAAIS